MIITRTPMRVSLAGGGTDLPAYFHRKRGAVISFSINRFVYITVNSLATYFDHRFRVSYSKTEVAHKVEEINHPIVREAIKFLDLQSGGFDVYSMADIPSGTGMGSSSSFAVALLHALHAFQGRHVGPQQLAEEACHLEIEVLKEPIGKQDQYIAAFGGLRHTEFHPDGRVTSVPVVMPQQRRLMLGQRLMLFFSGTTRKAGTILAEQNKQTAGLALDVHLDRIRDLADDLFSTLVSSEPLGSVGEILHESWLSKRCLVHSITNDAIDRAYSAARAAGAIGGKLLGAGGGGFLLLYAEPEKQQGVELAVRPFRRVPFEIDGSGSTVVYTAD